VTDSCHVFSVTLKIPTRGMEASQSQPRRRPAVRAGQRFVQASGSCRPEVRAGQRFVQASGSCRPEVRAGQRFVWARGSCGPEVRVGQRFVQARGFVQASGSCGPAAPQATRKRWPYYIRPLHKGSYYECIVYSRATSCGWPGCGWPAAGSRWHLGHFLRVACGAAGLHDLLVWGWRVACGGLP